MVEKTKIFSNIYISMIPFGLNENISKLYIKDHFNVSSKHTHYRKLSEKHLLNIINSEKHPISTN